ncbi:hypothetical protein REPUB_Repub15cG0113400 [Reevesia pubescens]
MEEAALQTAGQLIQPAATEARKSICNFLVKEYRVVKHISNNFKNLEEEVTSLLDKEADVQTELYDNRSRKEITWECATWLGDVTGKRKEISKLKYDYENRPSTYLCGLFPYCALRKLGKRVLENTNDVVALKNKLSQITIMHDRPPTIRSSHRWNTDVRIVNHPSLKNHVETLMDWLKDERLKRICIWGPPGVGKTTIMKTVHDKVCKSGQFDYTFRVTLTEGSRIVRDIQEVILNRLGTRIDENDHPHQRAAVISQNLEEKKYVLFLDEVSSVIDFSEVGINGNHKHGKVVFACRDKNIYPIDEDMFVPPLSMEDARKLFWEVVGSNLNRGHIKGVAEDIIRLCGGMPPILVLIGRHLVGKNTVALWRDMKLQLQSPSKQLWQEWEEYYRSFKLVYDELPDTDNKLCLLYWAIFPFDEEINRDYIIDCWTAEQFFEHQRLRQARDRGLTLRDSFMEKSLVEKGENFGHFKMFVCFQRAALRIANDEEDQNFFVENGKSIESHEWIQAKRVSLTRTCLSSLPEKPKCTGMLTLLLHENSLTRFPGQFFEHMPGLQVLRLRETGIRDLPSSISRLRNLKGLFLDNCSRLVQLPHQIGDLQSLEIFVFRHTGIRSLPSEIGQLRNLKCLRVFFKEVATQNHVTAGKNMIVNSGNYNHNGPVEKIIPANIIKNLSKLEELSIDASPNMISWNQNADEIAKEIATLKELTHLHFYFPHMESFEYFIQNSKSWKASDTTREFEDFRSFSIFVGEQRNSSASDFNVFECSDEKHLKFSSGDRFPAAVSEVLKKATSFELIGHTTARNLTDDLPDDALEELEACIVEECDVMQSIVNGDTNTTGGVVFKFLEKLHIKKLPNLVRIWEGRIPSESFGALRTLTLKDCQGMTVLFSLEMVRQLSKLQNLQVDDCTRIEKIIEADSTAESVTFPELKNFQLLGLRRLSSICDASLECHCLETILIKTCEELKSLPRILENASKLREIQCAEDWWDGLQWPNNETKERFRTLRSDPI